MQEMELKPSIITLLFLFFILSLPNSSQGAGAGAGANSAILESEIYEIDYRGPETHSYVPPPDRTGLGGHGRPFVHYHGPGRTNDGTDRP